MFLKAIRKESRNRNLEFIAGLMIAATFIFIAGALILMYLLFG